ncbi:formyltransferase family protein [Gammaproteobacteria bacterium]|nr:formyltransferase family protein [Gammaproteobacteria bacterium]
MKIGFMGRTQILAEVIRLVEKTEKHEVGFIWTSKAESYYGFSEDSFQKLADELGCAYINSPVIEDIRYPAIINDVDVVISINFVNIIPENFLAKFRHGIINAHAGNLPRYKGNACANWAILNDEKEIALTIHEMSSELDSGPIYLQEYFPLTTNTYITDVYDWLNKIIPDSFIKSLEMIDKGMNPKPQKPGKPLRTFPRKPEDSRIHLNNGAHDFCRLVRASSRPFSGAFCFLNDVSHKVFIYKSSPIKLEYDFYAVDGQILEVNKSRLSFVVSSKNEAIEINDYRINDLLQKDSFDLVSSSMRNRLV